MSGSIINKYRPKNFNEVIGNESVIAALQRALESPNHPHCYLFTGPSGTGKTSLARIIGSHLSAELHDIDAASHSGVDDMRELVELSQYMALTGNGSTLYIIDECFAPNTMVNTPDGKKAISTLQPNDVIQGICGPQRVNQVFCSWVDVHRVVRLTFASGRVVICSKEHNFLTPDGWTALGGLDSVKPVCTLQTNIPVAMLKVWDDIHEHRRQPNFFINETSNENKREKPQTTKKHSQKPEKDRPYFFTGMDRLTSIQRGNDALAGSDVKIHKLHDGKDYVQFHDLEINEHPSYAVEDLVVHNCHTLSKNAWQALLKLTEEPPEHFYVALCTTEPDKIPATISGQRAYRVELKSLSPQLIDSFLDNICTAEGWSVQQDVFTAVVQGAEGSPRKALMLMLSVHDALDREEVRRIVNVMDDSNPLIQICQLLMKGGVGRTPWVGIKPLLAKMDDDDFERAFIHIGRYLAACMIRSNDEKEAIKINELMQALVFPTNTFDKKVALYAALGKMIWAS